MAATKDDLRRWFRHGVAEGQAYLIVLCDTFDWDDYPKYAARKDWAQQIVDNPGDMQKVMEVYDLNMDMETQMTERRAWHL